MTSRRSALLVAATLLGACNGSDHPADQTRSATTAGLSSADRAELRAEMEWLLSPTPPCPPPPRLDGPPAAESVDAMLQLLGLEPTPAPRCLEGDQQP
jgi:hypothetical protein